MLGVLISKHLNGGYTAKWLEGLLRFLQDIDMVGLVFGPGIISVDSLKSIVKLRLKNFFTIMESKTDRAP